MPRRLLEPPLFVEESGAKDFLRKPVRRRRPGLCTRHDAHHGPISEAREEQDAPNNWQLVADGLPAMEMKEVAAGKVLYYELLLD
jgi:hypothetical protein